MVIEEILGHPVNMHAASAGILDSETSASTIDQLNERLGQDERYVAGANYGWML